MAFRVNKEFINVLKELYDLTYVNECRDFLQVIQGKSSTAYVSTTKLLVDCLRNVKDKFMGLK